MPGAAVTGATSGSPPRPAAGRAGRGVAGRVVQRPAAAGRGGAGLARSVPGHRGGAAPGGRGAGRGWSVLVAPVVVVPVGFLIAVFVADPGEGRVGQPVADAAVDRVGGDRERDGEGELLVRLAGVPGGDAAAAGDTARVGDGDARCAAEGG